MLKVLYTLTMLYNGQAYIVDHGLSETDCSDAQSLAYAISETTKSGAEFLCLYDEETE
jgi:hypothetical protein